MTTAKNAPAKKPAVRPSHRKAMESFLDTVSGPFRRSALSQTLYPLTSPRSNQVADALADAMMKDMARDGKIQRHGHQHWIKVSRSRTLRGGRTVPELGETMSLAWSTYCPEKWLSLDMETGDVWVGSSNGWRNATAAERKEALACLAKG